MTAKMDAKIWEKTKIDAKTFAKMIIFIFKKLILIKPLRPWVENFQKN
jgi:hypothetical protein